MTTTDLRLVPAALVAWGGAALVLGRPVLAAVVSAIALLGAVGLVVSRGRRRARRAGRTAWQGAVLALVALGAVTSVVAADGSAARSVLLAEAATTGERVTAVVRVSGDPRPLPDRWGGAPRFVVDVVVERVRLEAVGSAREETVAVPGAVVGAAWSRALPGERLVTSGTVRARGTDGRRARVELRGASAPALLADAGALQRAAGRLRAGLVAASEDLAPDGAALLPGLAVGDTSRVPDDLVEAMRTTGLTHLTAVSGAHFSLVGALVLAVTGLVRLPRPARVAVTATVLAGLVVLVRPDPSVLRAAATGCVGLVALAAGRRAAALPALACGVVVLLLLDPWLARSAGLALSVAATAGLVVGGPPVLAGLRGARRWVVAALAAPALAQLACGPVLVLLSPVLTTWALPANVLAAPAVGPATVLGLLAALVSPLSPDLAALLARGAGLGAAWIAWVARTVAAWPAATLPWVGGLAGAALLAVLEALAVVLVVRRVARARGVGGSWDP